MKTIVIGAGEVGCHIAERLSREQSYITTLERLAAARRRGCWW